MASFKFLQVLQSSLSPKVITMFQVLLRDQWADAVGVAIGPEGQFY